MLTSIPRTTVSLSNDFEFLKLLVKQDNSNYIPSDIKKSLWLPLFSVNLFIIFSEQNMVLWFTKINEVADERFGAIIMTVCSALSYTTEFLTKTIGLALIDAVKSYYRFMMVSFCVSIVTVILSLWVAGILDSMKKHEFLIKGDPEQPAGFSLTQSRNSERSTGVSRNKSPVRTA